MIFAACLTLAALAPRAEAQTVAEAPDRLQQPVLFDGLQHRERAGAGGGDAVDPKSGR